MSFTVNESSKAGGTEKVRKGTGYVSLSELPSDEEKEVSFDVQEEATYFMRMRPLNGDQKGFTIAFLWISQALRMDL